MHHETWCPLKGHSKIVYGRRPIRDGRLWSLGRSKATTIILHLSVTVDDNSSCSHLPATRVPPFVRGLSTARRSRRRGYFPYGDFFFL